MSSLAVVPEHETVEELLERAATAQPRVKAQLEERVIEQSLELARSLAARYSGRGESMDDLFQVASIGLVQAVRRYQPGAGASFAAFATPTILGELRRHFRDHAWAIRPPRRVQEALPLLRAARAEWEQEHAASPTTTDLAAQLDMPNAEVRELEQAGSAYSLTSLESAVEAGAPMPAERDEMDLAIDRLAVQRMLRGLSPRDRAIVYLRFYEELTQARIGEEFGQSQMQVSRTLSRILTRLRADLHQPAEAG